MFSRVAHLRTCRTEAIAPSSHHRGGIIGSLICLIRNCCRRVTSTLIESVKMHTYMCTSLLPRYTPSRFLVWEFKRTWVAYSFQIGYIQSRMFNLLIFLSNQSSVHDVSHKHGFGCIYVVSVTLTCSLVRDEAGPSGVLHEDGGCLHSPRYF